MTGLTYEERQNHPSRCTALRQDGQPCGKFATVGASVCYVHGGWAPHIRRAGLVRRMVELDLQAQGEAALNVMLPQELHKLVGGGGRGNKKAPAPEPAQPANEPAQVTLDGIARISRAEHLASQGRAIEAPRNRATAAPSEPLRPPGNRPQRPRAERKRPRRPDDREPKSASPTGPQVPRLMTMEEAFSEPPRRVTKRYREVAVYRIKPVEGQI